MKGYCRVVGGGKWYFLHFKFDRERKYSCRVFLSIFCPWSILCNDNVGHDRLTVIRNMFVLDTSDAVCVRAVKCGDDISSREWALCVRSTSRNIF